MAASASCEISRCTGSPARRAALAMASLPSSTASSRRDLAKYCRILVFARDEATKPSQSRLGPWFGALEVKISTNCPLDRCRSSGTSRPSTLAPIHRCPTSVCTA